MDSPFKPTWRRLLFAAVLALGAFFLPQEAPLEWYPLNNPSSGLQYLEIKYAGRTTWTARIELDYGTGFRDLTTISIPTSPTETAFTYTFPLMDGPIHRIRLDQVLSDPAQATIVNFRIINRRGEAICHFTSNPPAEAVPQASIVGRPGWELIANPDDARILLRFARPLIAEGMNERNLKRCLLSTGYLAGMLEILLLAVYFTFIRPQSWRAFLTSAGFLLFLSVCFSCVGNRGLIKNSLRYAQAAAALPLASEPNQILTNSSGPQALLRAGEKIGGIFGPGWYGQEGGFSWIAKRAHVTFKSGPHGKIIIKGYIPDLMASNRVTLRANGSVLHTQEFPTGAFTIECSVEPNTLAGLVIELQTAVVPKERKINEDTRELGAIITDVLIL